MAKTIEVPNLDLAGGVSIPQFGLGVFQVPAEQTFENVTTGIAAGYRHIDTAKAYGNEAEVGQAVRASGIPREDFFITTKLWNDDQSDAVGALKTSLGKLEMEHVDLYLIHWPAPKQDRYVEAWRGLIEAQQQGLVRAIGVSNFQAGAPAADHRRDRRHARRQPGRAAPAARAARPAPRARRPRHRHRGVEPAGAGRGAEGERGRRRSPRRTAARPARSSCAGTCSSATSSSRSR